METENFKKRTIYSDKIISSLKHQLSSSKFLYHYTNIEALENIIKSKELWATHASFLNDKAEISYSLNLINSTINNYLYSNKNDISLRNFVESVRVYYSTSQHRDLFLISFSEKKDDLNQWRSYTNNGKGVCLVFDNEEFEEIKNCYSIKYAKIIYDESEQRKCIEHIINESYSAWQSGDLNSQNASLLCRNLLDFLIPMFKDKAFKEEQEVRWILPNSHLEGMMDPLINFRPKNGILIPYIPLSNGKPPVKIKALKEIIIGPNSKHDLMKQSIDIFFRTKDYKVKIAFSEIPYREL